MLRKEIKRIVKENERYTRMLEYYDKTGIFPLGKTRKSFTIREMNFSALKETSKLTGKSMSDILDELIEGHLKAKQERIK